LQERRIPKVFQSPPFAFQIVGALNGGPCYKQKIESVLQAQDHRQVASCRHHVGDMRGADQADTNLTRKHCLGRPAGNDKDEIRIQAMLTKKAVVFRNPRGG
jgi:hypothetical protein